MSKNLTFTIDLEFSDKITSDKDIEEIAQNIERAIRNDMDGVGISPQNGDAYTTDIIVKHIFK